MPDPVTAIAVGGTQLLSSHQQGKAAKSAAGAQMEAAGLGIAEERRQFDALQELLKPYVQAGTPALAAQQTLAGLNGAGDQRKAIADLARSPEFAAMTRQGEQAMLQNASATGGLRGGNLQGALAQFRPQMLSSLIDQQYSRLGGLTTLGQNAAAGVGSAGMQSGNAVSSLLQQQGAAQAGGILGRANAQANMLNLPMNILGAQIGAGGDLGYGFRGLF